MGTAILEQSSWLLARQALKALYSGYMASAADARQQRRVLDALRAEIRYNIQTIEMLPRLVKSARPDQARVAIVKALRTKWVRADGLGPALQLPGGVQHVLPAIGRDGVPIRHEIILVADRIDDAQRHLKRLSAAGTRGAGDLRLAQRIRNIEQRLRVLQDALAA